MEESYHDRGVTKMAPIPAALHSLQATASNLSPRTLSISSRIAESLSSIILTKRQTQIVAVPATYANQNTGPQPGTVVGIVLGVVLGICFILWVLYTVFNQGGDKTPDVEIIERRSPRRSRHSDRTARSAAASEIIEVRRERARSTPRRTVERVIVEERRAPPPEDDIVEVIEEHSPVRRPRRSSGYRNVDPNEFGGGRRDRRGVR